MKYYVIILQLLLIKRIFAGQIFNFSII